MKRLLLIVAILITSIRLIAQTNPAITSWLRNTTGIVGRHYVSGNSTPITDTYPANVQTVQYSTNWVYVSCSGIPSYIIGPYLDGNPNQGANNSNIYKISLNPVQNTGTATATTGGTMGVFINGVSLFDYRDGVSWKSSTNALAGGPLGGTGDGVWNRDAIVAERAGFDCSKGHPAGTNYHHHQNPSAFNTDLNVLSTICSPYLSDALYTVNASVHSPLLGFAYDGCPIYGPYAYMNTNGTGGIVRMKSSYTLRNITTRTTYSNGTSVTAGPAVSTVYPLGLFREDYQYNATSAATPDYLDEHNGRFCVTPEYPNGIYCYFATVDANHNSAYPYLIGPTFYGTKTTTRVTSISETTTTYTGSTALSATLSTSNVACFGGSTGAIYVTPSGSTSPYTYNWGNGVTTQNRTGLAAGVYTVTITSASGSTAAYSSTITQPSAALATSASTTNIACFGNSTGAITLTPSGGTSPYTYSWTGGVTTQSRTGLAAGTYTATITDANSCTMTSSATLTQPTTVLTPSASTANVACFGGSTGAIYLTPSGGTSPYTYVWSGGVTTQNRTGLAAGTYTATITDANSCTSTISSTLSQPTAISISGTTSNATCGSSTGAITVSTSGGTAPYTYNWGAGITSQNRTGLTAGTYIVTVTDANSCTAPNTFTVSNSNAPSANASSNNVSCFGGTNGSITLGVTGGTSPYTYNWGNGITSQNRTNLAAGTYTVTITDASGCSAVVTQTLTQPTAITLSGTTTAATCGNSNGAISVSVAGGTLPYTYSWNGGATSQNRANLAAGTYTLTTTDANACTAQTSFSITSTSAPTANAITNNVACFGSATGSITLNVTGGAAPYTYTWSNGSTSANPGNLAAGNYTVTLTDANACTQTLSTSLTQPSTAITVSTSATAMNGTAMGTATATAIGGTAPYTYTWNNGSTNSTLTNLSAGAYTVTSTDANGCTASSTTTVDNTTGQVDLFELLSFTVFPNPANDLIFLQAQGLLTTSYEVRLVDVTGRILIRQPFYQGSTICHIETSTLYNGTYFLIVSNGQQEKSFTVELAR